MPMIEFHISEVIIKEVERMLYIDKVILLRQLAAQLKEIGRDLRIKVYRYNLVPANWRKNCISVSLQQNKVFFGIKTSKDATNEKFTAYEMLSGEYAALNLWQSSLLYDNINNDIQFWNDIESGKLKRFVMHFTENILDLYNNTSSLSTQ
jgi:hypothetical protein